MPHTEDRRRGLTLEDCPEEHIRVFEWVGNELGIETEWVLTAMKQIKESIHNPEAKVPCVEIRHLCAKICHTALSCTYLDGALSVRNKDSPIRVYTSMTVMRRDVPWIHEAILDLDLLSETAIHGALDQAVKNGVTSVIALYKNRGISVNSRSHSGRTVMHTASQMMKSQELIAALIDAGANVNIKTEFYNVTPLHLACNLAFENLDTVNALIEAGAQVNVFDHSGQTPLHAACLKGFPSVCEALLEAGATPNLSENTVEWDPPLHLVTGRKSADCHKCVRALLACTTTDINLIHTDNTTACGRALSTGLQETVTLLNMKGGKLSQHEVDQLLKIPEDPEAMAQHSAKLKTALPFILRSIPLTLEEIDLEPCPAFEAAVLKQNQGLLVGGHDYKPQCPRLSNIAASCVMSLTIGSKGSTMTKLWLFVSRKRTVNEQVEMESNVHADVSAVFKHIFNGIHEEIIDQLVKNAHECPKCKMVGFSEHSSSWGFADNSSLITPYCWRCSVCSTDEVITPMTL